VESVSTSDVWCSLWYLTDTVGFLTTELLDSVGYNCKLVFLLYRWHKIWQTLRNASYEKKKLGKSLSLSELTQNLQQKWHINILYTLHVFASPQMRELPSEKTAYTTGRL